MAVRKKEVSVNSKAKIKGRATVILYFFIILAVATGIILTCIFALFKINEITVVGTDAYTSEEIIAGSGIELGGNLLFANTNLAGKKIFENFPYVEKVSVNKKWPAQVEIDITQAQEMYSIEYQGNFVFVSGQGKILAKETGPKQGSVLVTAGEIIDDQGFVKFVSPEQQEIFQEIVVVFADKDISMVTSMNISNIHSIEILYDNRITMKLGNAADLSYKIVFGLNNISGRIKEEQSGVLDLTLAKEANKSYFSESILNSENSLQSSAENSGENSNEENSGETSEETEGENTEENEGENTEETEGYKENNTSEENNEVSVNRGEDIPDVE